MKKIIIVFALFFPLAILASWWNPFSWKTQPPPEEFGASVLRVIQGGTGASTFTSGECLVGNDTGAITTTSCGGSGASAWEKYTGLSSPANIITPTTTNASIYISGNATTTANLQVSGMLATGTAQPNSTTTANFGGNVYVQGRATTTGSFSAGGALYVQQDTGYVGIGTAAPIFHIHNVESGQTGEASSILTTDAQKSSTIATQGAGQAYFLGRDITNNIEFMMGTSILGGAFAGAMTAHDFWLRTDNVSRLTIKHATGNVGIGETSPGSKLSVSGGATIGSGIDTVAAPTNGLLVQGSLGIGITNPTSTLSVAGSVDIRGSATTTGNLIVGASSWAIPTNTLTVVGSTYITGNATTSGTFHSPEICIGNDCQTAWPSSGTGSAAWEQKWANAITPTTTTAGIFVNASSTFNTGLRITSDTTKDGWDEGDGILNITSRTNGTALRIDATSTEAMDSPLVYINYQGGQGGSNLLRISSNSTSSQEQIRLDGLTVGMEWIETDQLNNSGQGKYELRLQNNILQFNSRTNDDDSFEKLVAFSQTQQGGNMQLVHPDVGEFADFNSRLGIIGINTATTTNYFAISSDTTPAGGEGTPLDDILVVRNTGNVGIGTSTPATKLVLHGSGGLLQNLNCTSGSCWTTYSTLGLTKGYVGFSADGNLASNIVSGSMIIRSQGNTYLTTNGNAVRMSLLSSGNVGIGTTTPATLFQVGSVPANTFFSVNSSGVATSSATTTIGGNMKVYRTDGATTTIEF